MKKFLIQFVLLTTVIAAALLLYRGSVPSLPFLPEQTKYSELLVNEVKLRVEIADTPSKRSKGLGGRESLGQNEGMLFIFPSSDKYSFWMKGLKFPLDFVWIKDSEVVDITTDAQPPSSGKDVDLPIYLPKTESDKVLEVNSGTVERLKIKVGDMIRITSL